MCFVFKHLSVKTAVYGCKRQRRGVTDPSRDVGNLSREKVGNPVGAEKGDEEAARLLSHTAVGQKKVNSAIQGSG
jgi:hypothetical protein